MGSLQSVIMVVDLSPGRRGHYGVDAPSGLIGLLVVTGASLVAAGLAVLWGQRVLSIALIALGGLTALSAASYAYTTVRGKFAVWAEEVNRLALTGHEHILDLGCGRGAVLTHIARHLPDGRATGIDLWRGQDQSGNAREAALENASLEGVPDRVDLVTGDLRDLPFLDAHFDLIVSSQALHHIEDEAGRDRALAEAIRVLRPGGRLLVADIRHTSRYADTLRRAGAEHVTVRGLGWRFWYGGPWFATRMVSAVKPGSE